MHLEKHAAYPTVKDNFSYVDVFDQHPSTVTV